MKVHIFRGDEALGEFVLPEGEYLIGSGESAHLRLASELVAPEHARLKIGACGVEVEDLSSGLGTQFGDRPLVGLQRLPSGAAIRVGEFSVEFLDEGLDDSTGDRYQVGAVVASGAMGVIHSARELHTGREVAMKQMRPGIDDPTLVARFVQEAKITAHLEHPNVVPVHDVNPGADGSRFYTMKMVRGVSLEEIFALLDTRTAAALKVYPLETLLTIFQKVCDALAFAHSKGVIHRDLKPANIMVGEYGEVLVMDWGLAKLVGEAAAELAGDRREAFAAAGAGVTLAGTIMGTPHYMAPEQASGETEWVDERSDVYALGAILYQLLTLRTPVEGRSAREVLGKVREGAIVPPLERVGSEEMPHLPDGRIPASLAAVAMKAMSLSPERRYQRVPELQAEIRAYQSGFATGAEGAGAARQFALLLKRHKGVSTAIAASFFILAGLSAFYILSVRQERDNARASEVRATKNAEAALLSAEAEKRAKIEAETNARLAEERTEFANRQTAIARAAEEKATTALEEKLQAEKKSALAERKSVQAEEGRVMAETTAKSAEEKALQSSLAKTAAEAEAERARTTKVTQRIASLPAETDVAALGGDAGTVLVNSVFQLARESDANQQVILRRRIGAALRQMPRLLYLREGAQLARISPNGACGVFFEGSKGTLFDSATLKNIGPSLNHGPKGSVEAVEFGSDSRFLLSVGTTSPYKPDVWIWNAATGARVTLPPRSLAGNLECFLPYPDRSRVVTIHSLPKSKDKEINLWTLDGVTPTARIKTPVIDGKVSGLVPLARAAEFLLQSFNSAPGEKNNFVHRMVASPPTLTCNPKRDPALVPAAAISPDGSRAVQLVARELRFTEAPPPDASGKSIGAQVLSYLKGSTGAGVALRALSGEAQELLDARTGDPIGSKLTGGASTFSPDSQWLLMADGQHAYLHHTLRNDPARQLTFDLPGKASSLAFSADSSKAIVVTEGGHVSLWSTRSGRRVCPDVLLPSETKEISMSDSGRFLFVSAEAVSLWDTAPPGTRSPVNFKKLSSYATWVSGDSRRAIAIPPSAIPVKSGKGAAPATTAPLPTPMDIGASPGSLTLHDLENPGRDGRTVARRNEIPPDGTCWLTRNGRFLLVWGGGEGAKIWDLQKRSPRDIFSADHPRYKPPKYRHFYDGKGVVVVESPKDNRLGLVIEGAGHDRDALTSLFFDGTTGNELPAHGAIAGSIVRDTDGRQHVADLDGKATLALAASRLRRELPVDARRAFFSDDEKLVAILSTNATEQAVVRPVLSELLFHSDQIGKTEDESKREGRHYGFNPPAGRAWRLHVYDVPTAACLIGDVMLPALAAFRWEGARCIALSSDGRWTEIDLTPDPRTIKDLRDAAAVLTGRAIDPTTGSVAPVKQPIYALVEIWQRLRQAYPAGWQIGAK